MNNDGSFDVLTIKICRDLIDKAVSGNGGGDGLGAGDYVTRKLITFTSSMPQTVGTPYYFSVAKLPRGVYTIIVQNYYSTASGDFSGFQIFDLLCEAGQTPVVMNRAKVNLGGVNFWFNYASYGSMPDMGIYLRLSSVMTASSPPVTTNITIIPLDGKTDPATIIEKPDTSNITTWNPAAVITVPTPPSSGAFTLTANNGVMSWV